MMRALIASISLASSALKNSNLGGAADLAAWCACVAAASRAGQCAEAQTAENPVTPRDRKRRRVTHSFISGSPHSNFSDCKLHGSQRQAIRSELSCQIDCR